MNSLHVLNFRTAIEYNLLQSKLSMKTVNIKVCSPFPVKRKLGESTLPRFVASTRYKLSLVKHSCFEYFIRIALGEKIFLVCYIDRLNTFQISERLSLAYELCKTHFGKY